MVKHSRSFSAKSPEERHRRVCLPDVDDDDKYDAPHEEVEQQQQPVPEEESSASSDWGWFEDLDSEPVDDRDIVASHLEFTRRRHCSKAAVPKLDVNMSELHARVAHACLQKVDKIDQPVLATVAFLDDDRQWVASDDGLLALETDAPEQGGPPKREPSIDALCEKALDLFVDLVSRGEPEASSLASDPVLAQHRLVQDAPRIDRCTTSVIHLDGGAGEPRRAIGTVCVYSRESAETTAAAAKLSNRAGDVCTTCADPSEELMRLVEIASPHSVTRVISLQCLHEHFFADEQPALGA
jgi:hypothetical protein